jgi:hypothetical protein
MNETTREEKLAGMTVLEQREFEFQGRKVTELIVQNGANDYRVMWALSPFFEMVIDGVPNPIVSFSYLADKHTGYDFYSFKSIARRRVQEMFEDTLKNPPMHLLPTE